MKTVAVDLIAVRRESTPKAERAEALENYEYDLERFLKHSSTRDINTDHVALAAFLTSAYHSIEKGLTMEVPRAGFGERKLPAIMAAIEALESADKACIATRGARGCLKAYVQFHDRHQLALPAQLEDALRAFVAGDGGQQLPGGAITLTKKDVVDATGFDFAKFVRTRASIRHFTGESVAPKFIRDAVDLAIKSPRSCNREMRRVYAAYEPELRDHLLSFQHGNKGFGHKLGAVLVVTVDLREFDMIGERNQCWIDGGLFAMSLVYALHAAQLGTCMLNWSEDCEHDRVMRDAFKIPDNEIIITFIGVGHIPEAVEIAASPAPTAADILSIIQVR